MLKQRVITALVLLAVLLPALVVEAAWPFALLTLAAVSAAGWEWGRLNQLSRTGAVACGVGVGVVCSLWRLVDLPGLPVGWWAVLALWIMGGVWALRAGPAGWPRIAKPVRVLIGVIVLVAAWLALNEAKALGINFLLSVFALVWAADIAAYFGGRAFGRRKLAPSISPGKSWEGVYSGAAGVLLLAVVWMLFDRQNQTSPGSLYTQLSTAWGLAGLAVSLVVLVGLSVMGDLFESLVKRAAGAKDSSQLLPGHGGVLDRIDALLPIFPAALALLQF